MSGRGWIQPPGPTPARPATLVLMSISGWASPGNDLKNSYRSVGLYVVVLIEGLLNLLTYLSEWIVDSVFLGKKSLMTEGFFKSCCWHSKDYSYLRHCLNSLLLFDHFIEFWRKWSFIQLMRSWLKHSKDLLEWAVSSLKWSMSVIILPSCVTWYLRQVFCQNGVSNPVPAHCTSAFRQRP